MFPIIWYENYTYKYPNCRSGRLQIPDYSPKYEDLPDSVLPPYYGPELAKVAIPDAARRRYSKNNRTCKCPSRRSGYPPKISFCHPLPGSAVRTIPCKHPKFLDCKTGIEKYFQNQFGRRFHTGKQRDGTADPCHRRLPGLNLRLQYYKNKDWNWMRRHFYRCRPTSLHTDPVPLGLRKSLSADNPQVADKAYCNYKCPSCHSGNLPKQPGFRIFWVGPLPHRQWLIG